MSIAYDAKQAALKAHPDDREAAIDLFIGYVGMDCSDIEYELGETVEEYIFGKDVAQNPDETE
jgi:hypothetical protein